MVKYTLYCENGRIFRSGQHFLKIGTWLEWRSDRVILQHGLLSDDEAIQIRGQSMVNVYQDSRNNCVTITEPYASKYLKRIGGFNENLTQFIGILYFIKKDYYRGEVHVK